MAEDDHKDIPAPEPEKPAPERPPIFATARLDVEFGVAAAKPLQAEGPLDKASLRAKIEQHADKIKDANEVLAYLDQAQAPQSCEPTPAPTPSPATQPSTTEAWVIAHLKQMMEQNEIPKSGVRIGQLSDSLEVAMKTAKETNKWLKPVSAGHIQNHLREWVATAKIDIKIF
jgi:hypothetical protein